MAPLGFPDKIINQKLLVVEGGDDEQFFIALLKKLRIKGVYIRSVGGKNNFNDELPSLAKTSGFSDLTHIAIIRDSEGDNAFESVKNILIRKIGFTDIPNENGHFTVGNPKIGIFILPGNNTDGTMLEDLCLKAVEDHPAIKCVNRFIRCVNKLVNPPKNPSKAKSLAFLAAQPEYVNTIGLGAEKNYWNFESDRFSELFSFLNNLR